MNEEEEMYMRAEQLVRDILSRQKTDEAVIRDVARKVAGATAELAKRARSP